MTITAVHKMGKRAVKLYRKGYALMHIAAILGHKRVATTKRLVMQDPVRLADMVAKAL